MLFPSPALLMGCETWLGSTLEADAFLVGMCAGSCDSEGKIDTEAAAMCATPSLGCEAGCGVGHEQGITLCFTVIPTLQQLGIWFCL